MIFENTAALRPVEWKDKSGYTYGLHGTPPRSCWKSAWPRWKAGYKPCWHPVACQPLLWWTWPC